MFLFGIFTSHIPYIAFVLFYAYILVFGVEKATRGELQSEQKTFIAELQVEYHADFNDVQSCSYTLVIDSHNSAQFEPFIFKPKLKPLINHFALVIHADFYSSLSNRPPPFIG